MATIKGKYYVIRYLGEQGITGLANIAATSPAYAIKEFRDNVLPGASVESITELCDWEWEEE